MSGPPRPQFFVARADGLLTPMIAVDELPSWIRIVGVPATITPAGTQNMTSLGLKERSTERYLVLSADDSVPPKSDQIIATVIEKEPGPEREGPLKEYIQPLKVEPSKTGENEGKGSEQVSANNDQGCQAVENKADEPNSKDVESWRKTVHSDALVNENRPTTAIGPGNGKEKHDEAASAAKNKDDEASSAGQTSKSSYDSLANDNLPSRAAYGGMGTRGTLGKKVYCTHWIRWGECDYTQQGCLYKHEMPDEAKLQQIGIATYPRWFRIANPEMFNGVTDGPEWHRRPGPAPTDQLRRGPPPARPIELQSFENFRSNARPGPLPVARLPVGPPSPASGQVLFAFDPSANTFHSFGNINNLRSGYVQQANRQQIHRTPLPRVVTMRSPFIRQQHSSHFNSGISVNDSTADPSMSGHSMSKVTEISDDSAVSQSTSSNGHPNANFTHATNNGTNLATDRGLQQSRPQSTEQSKDLNEVYQPLVPSPAPMQPAGGIRDNNPNVPSNRFVPPPQTPPTPLKRYFIAPTGLTSEGSGSNGANRKKGDLLDL
ncbi:MAG: hypothetical protein HETSPECPRED_003596 [Heterodermia speciosa]|uniref:C3H1-type domain-containing protein n=1 Tax=Heterodermia speciosa TaxID=116794 RepID=A0A8H3FBL9_9LECA|nr:MAG: hypothetical protein HETSPECPRED_003596 [Heterodermia speciosa]